MKSLEFTAPFNSVMPPYNQLGVLMDPDGEIVDRIWGSTVPNVQRPGEPDRDNYLEYPVLAPGWYDTHYAEHGHRGSDPCLVLENNKPVPINQVVNPKTGKRKSADYIHVHDGYSEVVRGSAGCITLEDGKGKVWLRRNFLEDEKVKLFVPSPFPWFNYQDRGDIERLRRR